MPQNRAPRPEPAEMGMRSACVVVDVWVVRGRRTAASASAAAHDGPTPTTESLSAALKTALTPETRARAGEAFLTCDGRQRPQIGANNVNPLTTSAFDLPEHLSPKADP